MSASRLRATAVLAAAAAAALAAWGALTRSGGGRGGREDPPAGSFAVFCRDVVPVLDRRCGGCHGAAEDAFAALEEEPSNRAALRWIVDGSGRIATDAQRRLAFERCTEERSGGSGKPFRPLERRGPALASALARCALAEALGGRVHPEVFARVSDPDLEALLRWIEMEIGSRPEPPAALAPGAEAFFAEKVVPILERKTCFGANCHGMLAFNDLKLDPGIPALPGRYTPAILRSNRLAMLGAVTRLVNLSGDVEESKQLKKCVPVEQGGIVHKGGNAFLEVDDPDYAVLEEWLEREKAEACAATGAALGDVRGIVFVRRPRATPERCLEPLGFLPGAELVWLRDGVETSLTAGLHPGGPADLRAADVSYDGRRAVFAMRRAASEPFDVWEVEIETGAARQLTFSTDPGVHFVDPIHVPDPEDPEGRRLDRADLVVLSNAAGEVCDVSPEAVLGEAEGGTADAIEDDELTERAGTFDGRTLRVLRGANRGETRRIARQERGRIVLDRPLPAPCDSTTHYAIEARARVAPKLDLYRMPIVPRGGEREAFARSLRRMTWSPGQARAPAMRSSGETMATFVRSGWQGGRPFFNGAVFRTHADGSNFHTHAANRSGVPLHAENREMPDGLEVRVGRDADSWWGGMLILADHQLGPTIEDRNPADDLDHPYRSGPPRSAQTRFVPGWISLDPSVAWRGVSPGGAYHDACPMPDGTILVSFAPGPVDLDDPAAAPDFDILRLVPDPAFQSPGGFAAGAFRRELAAGGPGAELWPRPVAPRLKEPVSKALVTDEALLGPARPARGLPRHPEGTPAVLQVFDVPLLDAFFEQTTPIGARHLAAEVCPCCGRSTPEVDRVRFARVVGLAPRRAGGAAAPRRTVIAEVPIAEDGSICAVIPSGIPFDVESLNPDRMALRSPNRWLYALPGERHALSIPRTLYAQTCGGCHGGLTGSSADVLRRPDVVTAASRSQAIWDAKRRRRALPANWDEGGPATPFAVELERDVRPLLEARCASCHREGRAEAGLILTGARAHESLLGLIDRDDRRALRSYLVEKLTGRELHAGRPLRGDAPHPSDAPIAPEDLLKIVRWIDLGAQP